jgi:hypothetical protein
VVVPIPIQTLDLKSKKKWTPRRRKRIFTIWPPRSYSHGSWYTTKLTKNGKSRMKPKMKSSYLLDMTKMAFLMKHSCLKKPKILTPQPHLGSQRKLGKIKQLKSKLKSNQPKNRNNSSFKSKNWNNLSWNSRPLENCLNYSNLTSLQEEESTPSLIATRRVLAIHVLSRGKITVQVIKKWKCFSLD